MIRVGVGQRIGSRQRVRPRRGHNRPFNASSDPPVSRQAVLKIPLDAKLPANKPGLKICASGLRICLNSVNQSISCINITLCGIRRRLGRSGVQKGLSRIRGCVIGSKLGEFDGI